MADTHVQVPMQVGSLNGLKGQVTLVAGENIIITIDGVTKEITISHPDPNSYMPGGW